MFLNMKILMPSDDKIIFHLLLLHFKIPPVYDISYLTRAFFFCIARTVIWLCWWNISNWIKMKIAADCLLLFFCWGAIGFEKECSHWKFNTRSKYRLHNIQSVQDSSDSWFQKSLYILVLQYFEGLNHMIMIQLTQFQPR